ncbi:MAG: sialidase family protein [Bryobacteraceae bacterium]
MLTLTSFLLAAALFETGAVKQSDNEAFRMNAIPSIVRLASGKLLCAWTYSGRQSPKMRIVASVSTGGTDWSEPRVLIDTPGKNDADPVLLVDGKRVFVYSATVNVPDKLDRSQVFMVSSDDEGGTWSQPKEIRFPHAYTAGMVQKGIKRKDGTLLLPFAWDLWAEKGLRASTEGEMDLASGVLSSRDGIAWQPHGELHIWEPKMTPNSTNGLCEPAVVELAGGELLMIMRTGTSRHWESRSGDGGVTWSPPRPSSLTGHNTPTSLWRLDQNPEEIIAIWNNSPQFRHPLSVAISKDGGHTWSAPKNVAASDGLQVSYPGIVQRRDGSFIAVWQQQLKDGGRDIRWARFTREWVLQK